MSVKSIIDKQQEIINEFAMFDDWMEKYEYIIELGKDLPLIDNALKTEDKLIQGCQSKVWLDWKFSNGKMHFSADSDAIITKGMIGLLIRVLDNESPETILKSDLFFINEIGLQEHLSPTRANGLAGMVKKLKTAALESIA
jgi:cysteine desulfuration protein SufE